MPSYFAAINLIKETPLISNEWVDIGRGLVY